MNEITKNLIDSIGNLYGNDISDEIEISSIGDYDYLYIKDKMYLISKDSTYDNDFDDMLSYIINDSGILDNEDFKKKYVENLSDSWLLNNEEVDENVNIEDEFKEETEDKNLKEEYTTSQAKILDELSYLISTEYEAIKWYDEAIPMIQTSGMEDDLIVSTILGIEEIRKDEEDHVAHLERLMKQIKENKLIEGTNGNE